MTLYCVTIGNQTRQFKLEADAQQFANANNVNYYTVEVEAPQEDFSESQERLTRTLNRRSITRQLLTRIQSDELSRLPSLGRVELVTALKDFLWGLDIGEIEYSIAALDVAMLTTQFTPSAELMLQSWKEELQNYLTL